MAEGQVKSSWETFSYFSKFYNESWVKTAFTVGAIASYNSVSVCHHLCTTTLYFIFMCWKQTRSSSLSMKVAMKHKILAGYH